MKGKPKPPEKKRLPIKAILVHLLLFASVLLALLLRWVLTEWSGLSLDDIAITLAMSVKGTSSELIVSLLLSCVLPALLITAVSAIAFKSVRQYQFRRVFLPALLFLSCVVLIATGAVAYKSFDVGSSLGSDYSDFIDKNYVDPREVSITFPEKRNLIFIYLESMETTYADEGNGGAFAYNCIPELVELAQSGEDFSGLEELLNGGNVLTGATNTIKAMFAQSSGLPLKVFGNSTLAQVKSFFPNIVCLGNILENNGYTQELLYGSSADFAGTAFLFTQHGNYRIRDYDYARENGWIAPDYSVWWGYEDEKLFSFAKQELLRLAQEDRPFNLTLATMDTHFEDGYTCRLCRDEYPDNPYANVMRCSSRQISAFVKWLQTQEFYPNTTVVLVGDHLTMDKDFCKNVSSAYHRKVFTAYLNAAASPKTNARREYSTFDIFPTTLAALGAEIPGDRLGLGTNLFSEKETLCEIYGIGKQNEELAKRSRLIDELQIAPGMECIGGFYRNNIYAVKDYSPGQNEMRLRFFEKKKSELPLSALTLRVRDAANNELDSIPCQMEQQCMTAILDLDRYSAEELYIAPEGVVNNSTVMLNEITIQREDCLLYSNEINSFLNALIGTDYAVLFSAMDEAAEGLDAGTRAILSELGLQEDLEGQIRSSYCAVIDRETVLAEALEHTLLERSGTLSDGTAYSISSAGFDPESTEEKHGSRSEIQLDGIDYSLKKRGLNIVVYDTERHEIVTVKSFDTHMKAESSTRLYHKSFPGRWILEIEAVFPEESDDVELWVSEPGKPACSENSTIYLAKKNKDGLYQVSIKDASSISGKTGRIYLRNSDWNLYLSEEFPILCERGS